MASLAYIQITRKCNQNCRFCSNPPTRKRLSLSEGKKLIDSYIKKGYDGIIFTGGEPTIYPHLLELIRYAEDKKISHRIITNGQKLADFGFLEQLKKAGLYHIHLSIYSIRNEVQEYLTRTPGCLENTFKALENLQKIGGISVNINTVINHYNAGYLLENVKFIVKNFPLVNHFVWNLLDPTMNRVRRNKDVIPKLNEFELSLHQAMEFLEKNGKTFRTEMIPLCYLPNYEWTLNETRKLVKKEARLTFFLDNRKFLFEKADDWGKRFGYQKAKCCKICSLNSICPGLHHMDKYYFSKELFPVFISKEKIIKKIIETSKGEKELLKRN